MPPTTMNWADLLNPHKFEGIDAPTKAEGIYPFSKLGAISPYQDDHDNILFSRPFRRLAKKMQVHPIEASDHMHNRMIHTIEVASTGRLLGHMAGTKLKDKILSDINHRLVYGSIDGNSIPFFIGHIVEAACYAHDIGNTAFGHAGETAIKEVSTKYYNDVWDDKVKILKEKLVEHDTHGYREVLDILNHMTEIKEQHLLDFESNAQSFRILTKLQHNYYKGGMHLTYATIAAFMKYPWNVLGTPDVHKGKFNAFSTENDILHNIAKNTGLIRYEGTDDGIIRYARHPLAYLVEAADDICNGVMDFEDAIERGILTYRNFANRFNKIILKYYADTGGDKKRFIEVIKSKTYPEKNKIGFIRSKVIEVSSYYVIEAFCKNIDTILHGEKIHSVDGQEKDCDLIYCTGNESLSREYTKLRTTYQNKLYRQQDKVTAEASSYFIYDTIFSYVLDAYFEWVSNGLPRGEKLDKLSAKSRHTFILMGDDSPDSVPGSISQKTVIAVEGFRRCIDFVSGMTDSYAIKFSRQLRGV